MIPQPFGYTAPATLEEALRLLADGGAKPLAGGMSLIPLMKLRFANPEHLVDIGRLSDLNYIREENGALHIGAATTHYEVESSPLVRARCPLLAETVSHIGDMQVRNMGTMGGSVAHADPAADYPAALLAMEAKLVLARQGGERTVPIGDFFVDIFTTALDPGEIIREIVVPFETSGTGVAYEKVVQPASGFAIVGVAVRIRKDNGKVGSARIGVTGLANKPLRALETEKALEGSAANDGDLAKAFEHIAAGAEINSDIHASAAYREHLARVHGARALRKALSGAHA